MLKLTDALRFSPRDPDLALWLRLPVRRSSNSGIMSLNPRQPLQLRALAAAYAISGHPGEGRRYLAELKETAPDVSQEGLFKRGSRPRATAACARSPAHDCPTTM